jgi:hypothetical protein
MLRFEPRRVDRQNNNTPIIYNRELDDYAHKVLMDYKPELLREPGRINWQHFIESYLEREIEFYDIYTKDPERPIFGLIAFERGKVRVFADKDKETVRRVVVNENTIILDNYLRKPGKESFALFCGLHEGCHDLLHWDVYTSGDEYEEEFLSDIEVCPVVCCRREDIESFGLKRKERTAAEWREYQADYLTAAISMPLATFRPFVNSIMRDHGYYKGAINLGMDEEWDILGETILPHAVNEVYGTSVKAAKIKLKQTGFVISRPWND